MALNFVTAGNAPVGSPLHVTVYLNGVALDPATSPVVWSSLNPTTSVTPDATGYNFMSTVAGSDTVTGTFGQSTGNFVLTFTVPPLEFTCP